MLPFLFIPFISPFFYNKWSLHLLMVSIISITIMAGNKSLIALSMNLVFHNRSKHIKTKFHFIRTCFKDKNTDLDFIRSQNQLAHLFTKAFRRLKFEELRQRLGICEV